MNANLCMMEHFPSVKSFDESLKKYQTIVKHFDKQGYGWWAVSENNRKIYWIYWLTIYRFSRCLTRLLMKLLGKL